MKQSIDEKRKWIRILPTERMDYRSIYYLDMSDDIRYLFEPEQCFGIEWPFSVENMPESILIIPLLSQLLPSMVIVPVSMVLSSGTVMAISSETSCISLSVFCAFVIL